MSGSERDALAALLIENRRRDHPISAYLFDPKNMADAILAAGWRPPTEPTAEPTWRAPNVVARELVDAWEESTAEPCKVDGGERCESCKFEGVDSCAGPTAERAGEVSQCLAPCPEVRHLTGRALCRKPHGHEGEHACTGDWLTHTYGDPAAERIGAPTTNPSGPLPFAPPIPPTAERAGDADDVAAVLTQDERRSVGCSCTRLDGEWHHNALCVVPLIERILSSRAAQPAAVPDPAGSWVCGRCDGASEQHAEGRERADHVYDPVWRAVPDPAETLRAAEPLVAYLSAIRTFVPATFEPGDADICHVCGDGECGGACPGALWVVRQVLEAFDSEDDREWWRDYFADEGVAVLGDPSGALAEHDAEVWDDAVDAAFRGAITRQNAEDVKRRNPYRSSGSDSRTHGLNHAPLPDGTWLAPGFCAGCDADRLAADAGSTQ